jgi:hypothetical protein
MQIYPKVWLKALSDKFGRDLESDSTNVKYGVYILDTYIKRSAGGTVDRTALNKGLLRYNGCVVGAHTKGCHNYPSKVAKAVERQGASLCAKKNFFDCIAKPFTDALLRRTDAVPAQ